MIDRVTRQGPNGRTLLVEEELWPLLDRLGDVVRAQPELAPAVDRLCEPLRRLDLLWAEVEGTLLNDPRAARRLRTELAAASDWMRWLFQTGGSSRGGTLEPLVAPLSHLRPGLVDQGSLVVLWIAALKVNRTQFAGVPIGVGTPLALTLACAGVEAVAAAWRSDAVAELGGRIDRLGRVHDLNGFLLPVPYLALEDDPAAQARGRLATVLAQRVASFDETDTAASGTRWQAVDSAAVRAVHADAANAVRVELSRPLDPDEAIVVWSELADHPVEAPQIAGDPVTIQGFSYLQEPVWVGVASEQLRQDTNTYRASVRARWGAAAALGPTSGGAAAFAAMGLTGAVGVSAPHLASLLPDLNIPIELVADIDAAHRYPEAGVGNRFHGPSSTRSAPRLPSTVRVIAFRPYVVIEGARDKGEGFPPRAAPLAPSAGAPFASLLVEEGLPVVPDQLAVSSGPWSGPADARALATLDALRALAARSPGGEDAVWVSVLPDSAWTDSEPLLLDHVPGAARVAVCTESQLVRVVSAVPPRRARPSQVLRIVGLLEVGRFTPLDVREESRPTVRADQRPSSGSLAWVVLGRGGAVLQAVPTGPLDAREPALLTALIPISPEVEAVVLRQTQYGVRSDLFRRERIAGQPSTPTATLDLETRVLGWSWSGRPAATVIELGRSGVWTPFRTAPRCATQLALDLDSVGDFDGLRLVVGDGWNSAIAEVDPGAVSGGGDPAIRTLPDGRLLALTDRPLWSIDGRAVSTERLLTPPAHGELVLHRVSDSDSLPEVEGLPHVDFPALVRIPMDPDLHLWSIA